MPDRQAARIEHQDRVSVLKAALPASVFVLAVLAVLASAISYAHSQSETYLAIVQSDGGSTLNVSMDVALRELEHVMRLDANADGQISAAEVHDKQPDIVAYASSGLRIAMTEPRECPLRFSQLQLTTHLDVSYATLRFNAHCPQRPLVIDVRYSLLFEIDAEHRALAEIRSGSTAQALVFARQSQTQRITFNVAPSAVQFTAFLKQGIAHIWEGYDHMLFLLTLLLPAVVLYRDHRWLPRESLRETLIDIVQVVTAFTLAHSITLMLGTLGWISLPTRLVESAIALTVLLGALNLLFPLVQRRRWLVALGFGLIHGLAFASVLIDLGLQGRNLLIALLGFNLGVEVGQLAIVVVLIPLIHAWRRSVVYPRVLMPVSAVVIASVAAYWFVSRAFG